MVYESKIFICKYKNKIRIFNISELKLAVRKGLFFHNIKKEKYNSFPGIFLRIYSQLCPVKNDASIVMLSNAQTYNDRWQNCLDRIKAQTSEEEFRKWFQPIVPLEFDGTTLRLRVPNESYVRQIEKNYIPFLRPIISQLYGQQTRLHYAVPRPTANTAAEKPDNGTIARFNTQTNTANIKNPFVIPGLKKIIINPQLNPNLTFATFIEGECNRLARSAGMSVAVSPGNNPFNPLYIYGNSGLGKTHIVQSIGHEVRQRHPELQVLYVSMNKFQAQFQTAYKNGEIPDFIHFYQMIDVLIIDDIQELTGKTGTQNAFFNIFNHLQLSEIGRAHV